MGNNLETICRFCRRTFTAWVGIALWMACTTILAQDFSVRVSTNKAYVNQQIQLIVQMGTDQFEAPDLPKIDGCDFELAGPPIVATQISIFNGRESRLVTTELNYLITPRREGSFVIPELTFVVNGKDRTTEAFEFTAEKSETGDLLEAEIHGLQDTIFVGQSLEVVLKIWVKAFRDPQRRVTLSTNDTFGLLVKQTEWGIFESTLTSDSFRLKSEMVMKKDAAGKPVEYCYFEIPATIYADRPGPVDTGKVKIICDYPVSLVASRDPFDVFGKRLSIGSSRPIEAMARSNSLIAIDVPSEGKPENYRGAVGEYRITTAAMPTKVSVGDPIKFQIAIEGTGRIDLLQAPPLSSIEALTKHYKVSSDPLPGFVREPQKFFLTSIRAIDDGVSEIPSIPFHFFNPKTEAFETVYSDPISIEVSPVESLSLSGFEKSNRGLGADASSSELEANDFANTNQATFDFTNNFDSFLESPVPTQGRSLPQSNSKTWWYSMLAPPALWLACIAWLAIPKLRDSWSRLQPADVQCRKAISEATRPVEIRNAIRTYLSNRFDQSFLSDPSAVGALRRAGLRDEAVETERLLNQLTHVDRDPSQPQDDVFHFDGTKQESLRWLSKIHKLLSSDEAKRRELLLQSSSGKALKSGITLLAILFSVFAGGNRALAQQPAKDLTRLNADQRSELFRSANELYRSATDRRSKASETSSSGNVSAVEKKETDEQFLAAAKQYQRLIEDGIRSETVFLNAANAYAQANATGLALLNYRRVLWLNPDNIQAANNLRLLDNQRKETRAVKNKTTQTPFSFLGHSGLRWATGIGSILFWSLMIASLFLENRISIWGAALIPLAIVLSGLWGLSTDATFEAQRPGVVLKDTLELRESDGESFSISSTLVGVEGSLVDRVQRRGDWVELRVPDGTNVITGWTQEENVGNVAMETPRSQR